MHSNFSKNKMLICDDHPIVIAGVKYSLKQGKPSFDYNILSTSSGKNALEILHNEKIDILFLDIKLPDISGIEILKNLRQEKINTKVVVLTGEEHLPTLMQILRYKPNGILLKSYSIEEFHKALDHIERDNESIYLDSSLNQVIIDASNKKMLTPREFEVLELVIKGYTNKSISEKLECSFDTIKTHLSKISSKMGFNDRDNLIDWYYRGIDK